MFERLTDRARRCVVLAQEAARYLGAPGVDTTHLLLGLIQEGEGVAAKVLNARGVGVDLIVPTYVIFGLDVVVADRKTR